MKAHSVLETIGSTPHIRFARLFPGREVWIKSERGNPGGSIKDRIALSMVEAAERDGALRPGGVIVEPTSGNTGIGLALVAAVKGYRLILVMPESMSIERRRLMLAYGAEFVLTAREKGMRGAIERAQELVAATPGAWMPQQFENPANVAVHAATTAREILADFPDGIDALITGVGTGGHITGVAQVLKPLFPRLKVFAVEPTLSPVISGGKAAPHPIQGIGAGFVPANLHTGLLDGVIQVDPEAAREMATGRFARRHLVRRHARRDRAIPAVPGPRGADPGLRLRYRRTLSLGRGLPAVGCVRRQATGASTVPIASAGSNSPGWR
jgi:cysteine synthase A